MIAIPFKTGFSKFASSSRLIRILSTPKPKSLIKRMADKALYGADELIYLPRDTKPNLKTPKKLKGTVLFDQGWQSKYFKGTRNIGRVSGHSKGVVDNKIREAGDLVKAKVYDKSFIYSPGSKVKGKKVLTNLQRRMGSHKNYFVKSTDEFNTGVGGSGFVNRKDIETYLSGRPLSPKKVQTIRDLMRSPKKFFAQGDLKIKKDFLGSNQEFRVHGIGREIVQGGSSPRGGNILSALSGDVGKAEEAYKKIMQKLPKHYKNLFMSADIAKTKGGKFKVIELNPGPVNSGMLDPDFLAKQHKGIKGKVLGLEGMRKNLNLYKQITGRTHPAKKAIVGTALTGAGASGYAYTKSKKREDTIPSSSKSLV